MHVSIPCHEDARIGVSGILCVERDEAQAHEIVAVLELGDFIVRGAELLLRRQSRGRSAFDFQALKQRQRQKRNDDGVSDPRVNLHGRGG